MVKGPGLATGLYSPRGVFGDNQGGISVHGLVKNNKDYCRYPTTKGPGRHMVDTNTSNNQDVIQEVVQSGTGESEKETTKIPQAATQY